MILAKKILILGDLLVLALVTVIGFASHGETDISYLPRMAVVFFPLCAGWFLVSPWIGLFEMQVIAELKQLWRVPLAFLFAAPLAGAVRGFILGAAVLPVFVLILGVTSAVGMMAWRSIFTRYSRRIQ